MANLTTGPFGPYLGSKISLTSKSAIRYEGTLYSIDTKEMTVALAKVRSFGTEDRPTDRPVGPSSQVYEYVIFRGSNIQEIVVCQPPRPQPVLEGGLPNDPAIVQHSAIGSGGANTAATEPGQSNFPAPPIFPSHATSFSTTQAGYNAGDSSSVMDLLRGEARVIVDEPGRVRQDSVLSHQGHQDQRGFMGQQNRGRDAPGFYRGGRGRGSYQQNRGGPQHFTSGRGGARRSSTGSGYQPGRPTKPKETLKFETEFDFEQANEEFKDVLSKFEKASLEDNEKEKDSAPVGDSKDLEEAKDGERQDGGKVTEPEAFYDKAKSFFDKISCNAIESSRENPRRPNWKVEKKINKETFGVTGNFNSGRGRRGGFQRGRGGSGGYNRNQGGYNKPSNGYNQGGFYGGYNGFGRFSRENPPAFSTDRRQSNSSGYHQQQQFHWAGWGQQQQQLRSGGRGSFRGNRGRQWGNNSIF